VLCYIVSIVFFFNVSFSNANQRNEWLGDKIWKFYRAGQVYHVTVMPCYDKKLEAARDDFVFSVGHEGENGNDDSCMNIKEVDSVLTTGEVLDLIQVLLLVI